MPDDMTIDLAPLLAAIVDIEGGEYRIPYATLRAQQGAKALALDPEDDGATLVIRVVDIVEDDNGTPDV